MKNASTALKTYLASTTNLIMADLWTITLINGTILRYTNADINLNPSSNLFTASDVLVEGGELDAAYGLDANNTLVTCYPSPNSFAGGVPFLVAAASGQFDRATIRKERIFMPKWGDVTTLAPAVLLFLGQVTGVKPTRYTCELTCKDAKNLLNIYMPRRQYQPTCAFVFGDASCGFDRSSIAVNSTTTAGSSLSVLLATALTQVAGFFNNGTVKFTSGLNNGISRTVKTYNPGYIQLVAPFPNQPQVGDTFTVTPGCNKTFAGQTTTDVGTVVNGVTASTILNNIGAAPGTYNGNNLIFTSGGNNGLSLAISSWLTGEAIMSAPFPNAPAVGDTFNITDASNNILVSGSVTTPLSSTVIPTSLSNADGFFNGGTISFTSGANQGQTQTISSYADGIATMVTGFGATPALGDSYTISSAPSTSQGSCTGYWGAAAPEHFGGERFVPVPETAY